MVAELHRDPHQSAMTLDEISAFKKEAKEKYSKNQYRLISWEEIKDNPPPQLNISLVE